MNEEDWKAVIAVMASAPLNNMQHANAVDALMMKVMREVGLVEQPAEVPPLPVASFGNHPGDAET